MVAGVQDLVLSKDALDLCVTQQGQRHAGGGLSNRDGAARPTGRNVWRGVSFKAFCQIASYEVAQISPLVLRPGSGLLQYFVRNIECRFHPRI